MARLSVLGVALVGVAALGAAALAYGQAAEMANRDTASRDAALARIEGCERRNEASNRECKHFNQDVATLVEVYRSGDKTVLPTLFHFTYLTDFYDGALLADPDGFLVAMAQLSPKEQQAVAVGIAGGVRPGLYDIERFRTIRDLLANVPEVSPTKAVADACLRIMESNDAALFVNYFPPETFKGRAANFQIAWYSKDMYELGEKPLWPPTSASERTFRLTYLGSFSGTKSVTLTVLTDGSGEVKAAVRQLAPGQKMDERRATASEARVSSFLERLNRASFWEVPTESPQTQRGFDGAEWILEGVQDGRYHVVDRWCPGLYKASREDVAFAEAAVFLLSLAGEKHGGGCR